MKEEIKPPPLKEGHRETRVKKILYVFPNSLTARGFEEWILRNKGLKCYGAPRMVRNQQIPLSQSGKTTAFFGIGVSSSDIKTRSKVWIYEEETDDTCTDPVEPYRTDHGTPKPARTGRRPGTVSEVGNGPVNPVDNHSDTAENSG